jgi:acetylornithine deacetylase/succinyl-diaminopimelate desuccinylase-like protein
MGMRIDLRNARLARAAARAAALSAAVLTAGTATLAAQPARDVVRAVRAWHEPRQAQIVRELAGLLAIPNLASDSVNIRRNADTLVAMLTRRGFAARRLENGAYPPAVFGERRTPGATRTIVFYMHYDGQPVTPSQWTTPPWAPVLRSRSLEDGGTVIPIPASGRVDGEARLYARSASDDKSPIIALLAALDALDAAKQRPSVNLKVFLDGEEEAGSEHVRTLLERHRALLAADAWLFGDGPVHQSRAPQLVFGVRGVIGAELTVYGPLRALHSGHYGNWAPNPAMRLATLLAAMRSDDGEIRIPGFMDDVRPITAAERAAVARVPDVDGALRRELGLAGTEANSAPSPLRIMLPSLDIRGLRSGGVGAEAANAIPTEATASLSFRLVPDQQPTRVRTLVEGFLRAQGWHLVPRDSATLDVRLRHPKLASLTWGDGYPALRTSLDAPVSRALTAVATEALGQLPVLMPTLGGSLPMHDFADVLRVPLIVVPIVNHDNRQHAADENLRLQNLWDGIELYAAIIARLGAAWPGSAVP